MSKRRKKYHHPILLMPLPPPMWVADEKGKLHLSDKTKKEMEQTKKTQEKLLDIYYNKTEEDTK